MSHKSSLRRYVPALIAAGILALAACTGAATPSPSPIATPTAGTSPPAEESPTGGAVTFTVNVATGSAGDYLTGEDGRTLYVKGDDSTSATTCTGDCLGNWPPLTLEAGENVVAGTGVTGTLATFTRPEGTTQVTYNDKPLYYFAGDTAAGDTKGVGLLDWTVAAP